MYNWPLMVNNLEKSDLELVIDYLKQDDPKLTHGPNVARFESEWSDWLGIKNSVMVNSGASANDLTMLIIKELHGPSEIIVPPLTWISDIASIIHAGHKPIFADISLSNLALDSNSVEQVATKKTGSIFLTHILGINGMTSELLELSKSLEITLVEDVCESHGATFQGKKLGNFGLISNFSFYYAHHMTTIEGGMISTDDNEIYEMARMMRSHGLVRESKSNLFKKKYVDEHSDLNPEFIFAYAAHNMRPTEINGILGINQLKRLDKNISLRTENFNLFVKNLDSSKYITNYNIEGSSSYAFPIILREKNENLRDKIETILREKGIEFRRGLSGGGNQLRQPYLKKFVKEIRLRDFPNVEHIHFYSWYVGNYPSLEKEKIFELCKILNAA